MASKRKGSDDKVDGTREKCLFGEKCYRRNPEHFTDYSHPHLESLTEEPNNGTSRDQWLILNNLGLVTQASPSKISREGPASGSDSTIQRASGTDFKEPSPKSEKTSTGKNPNPQVSNKILSWQQFSLQSFYPLNFRSLQRLTRW